jgi:hypothetical protein
VTPLRLFHQAVQPGRKRRQGKHRASAPAALLPRVRFAWRLISATRQAHIPAPIPRAPLEPGPKSKGWRRRTRTRARSCNKGTASAGPQAAARKTPGFSPCRAPSASPVRMAPFFRNAPVCPVSAPISRAPLEPGPKSKGLQGLRMRRQSEIGSEISPGGATENSPGWMRCEAVREPGEGPTNIDHGCHRARQGALTPSRSRCPLGIAAAFPFQQQLHPRHARTRANPANPCREHDITEDQAQRWRGTERHLSGEHPWLERYLRHRPQLKT